MRDALGGTVVIAIIVVFTVIMIGYLAFNVNYTKAFRMKDKVITYYNEYNGNCNSTCQDEILHYAKSIGYSVPNTWNCPTISGASSSSQVKGLFCAYKFNVDPSIGSVDDEAKYYYKIVTKIYLDIPVISNIFHFDTFTVSGNTKLYKVG